MQTFSIIDDYVDRLVSEAPPLTPEQADRLRVLLAGRRPVHSNTADDLAFREDQARWRRRIAASRRMEPLEDGTIDPVAPEGGWAS